MLQTVIFVLSPGGSESVCGPFKSGFFVPNGFLILLDIIPVSFML